VKAYGKTVRAVLSEIAVLAPQVESLRGDAFKDLGLPQSFVQEDHSYFRKTVLRGLHFQWDPPMGKLMRVTRVAAFLVAVDVRRGRPMGRRVAFISRRLTNSLNPSRSSEARRHRRPKPQNDVFDCRKRISLAGRFDS
jgi:hypothetical protein